MTKISRGGTRRGPQITRTQITWNQPVPKVWGNGWRKYGNRSWDFRDPKLTGELLLAGIKENA